MLDLNQSSMQCWTVKYRFVFSINNCLLRGSLFLTNFLLLLTFLTSTAFGETLNFESSFEVPEISGNEAVVDNATFGHWTTLGSLRLKRDSGASRGGQYLEFPADGSNADTHLITQELTAFGGIGVLRVHLRTNGEPAENPLGQLSIRLRDSAGVLSEKNLFYDEISASWAVVALPATDLDQANGVLKIEIITTSMGTNTAFSVCLDQVQLNDNAPLLAPNLLNASFEQQDIQGGDEKAVSYVDDWVIFSPSGNAESLRLIGGQDAADGTQFVRATGNPTNELRWNGVTLPDQDVTFWENGYRYELSAALRYSGIKAEIDGPNDVAARLFLETELPPFVSIVVPRYVLHWELESDWQRFSTRLEPFSDTTALGSDFRVRTVPINPMTPGSSVEIDDIRLDKIHPIEAISHYDWMIGNNRIVPNWLLTEAPGEDLESQNANFFLDLPQGVVLEAVGAADDVAGPVPNSVSTWTMLDTGIEVQHGGEQYRRWEITPAELSSFLRYVGPIYLSSTLPDDSRIQIYHQSNWDGGSSQFRAIETVVKNFPQVRKPAYLRPSLYWSQARNSRGWPNFSEEYAAFGFSSVGFHRQFDGYDSAGGAAPQVLETMADVRARGLRVVSNDSSFLNMSNEIVGQSIDLDGNPIDKEACPSAGPLGDSQVYLDDLAKIATHVHDVQPDTLTFDIEHFEDGAERALDRECLRCESYLSSKRGELNDPGLTMEEALAHMGSDMAADIRQALIDEGVQPLPEIAYYGMRPGGYAYTHIFDFDLMESQGVADLALIPHHSPSPKAIGEKYRLWDEAGGGNRHFFPIINSGVNAPTDPVHYDPVRLYDFTNESFGSGAKGMYWFAFVGSDGADLYYFSKAMQAILPVEEHLVNATRLAEGSVGVSESGLQVTTLRDGGAYLFLISTYEDNGTAGYDAAPNEGPIVLTLPQSVRGVPIRLADQSVAGPTAFSNQVKLHYSPGVEGARTALYYLCDLDSGDCFKKPGDADGDGIPDLEDNCPFASNPDQADSGGVYSNTPDGIGDVCQCGDIDQNGIVELADAEILQEGLSGEAPYECVQAPSSHPCQAGESGIPGRLLCDVNGDGICNETDFVLIAFNLISQVCHFAQPNASADSDDDGIADLDDNCVWGVNPDQSDTDGDGVGDACLGRPVCSDGIDNDSDAWTDFPDDPGCLSAAYGNENPACSDGMDNDGDGLTDSPNDLDCLGAWFPVEVPGCNDGADNDNDGLFDTDDDGCLHAGQYSESDPNCGIGFELILILPPLLWRNRRSRISSNGKAPMFQDWV